MPSLIPAPAAAPGSFEDFDTVRLSAGDLEATFLPDVGMLAVSLRHAGAELLDRRAGVAAYAERGELMGLPLLHPWANRLAAHGFPIAGREHPLPPGSPLVHCEEHGLPIHGLLAGSPYWRVAPLADGEPRLRATLDFGAHQELLAAFPFPHEITIDAALSATALTVTTTLQATGDAAVPVAFGFHPYLRLPGDERERWQLSLPRRRPLIGDPRGLPRGAGAPRPATRLVLGGRGYDDGFDRLPDGAAFRASDGERRISVVLRSGYPAGQVYSPPGAPFICFEPMTAPTNALRSGAGLRHVRPGERFTAVFAIEVETL